MEHIGARIVLIAVIIAVNGFFAAAEVALVSVRVSRLRQMAEEGRSGAHAALALLANPERLLSVTQVGVTLASLGLGWAGEGTVFALLVDAFHPVITPATSGALHALSFALAFLIISYLHIVLGEVLPKNIAFDKADRLAVVAAPALMVFYRIAMLFVLVIEKSSHVLSRALGVRGQARGGGHSAEEIKLILSSSRGRGVLPPAQEEMLRRILDLGDIMVREIMMPRNDMISVPVEATLEQVLHTIMEHQHSRLPVYEGKSEQIVGVLYSKDLLALWEERRAAIREGRLPRQFSVRRLMRKYIVVPETKPLTQMLDEFRTGKSHMAMVVDEFGTIAGLITVEDVLEQIVGDIADEYDEKLERPLLAAAELELDGATRIRDLDDDYGIALPADAGFETLAGFLLYRLKAIPQVGEYVDYEGRRFTVIEMERNRVARVRIEKLEEQPAAPVS